MADKKNELTTQEEAPLDLAALGINVNEVFAKEMDGLGDIPFEVIKVPGGGHIAFEVPGDDEDNPDVVKELVGVIVHQHQVNAYWDKDRATGSDESNAPLCSSHDGHTGYNRISRTYCSCKTCENNRYGSAANGRGKACKNMRQLYFLMGGRMMPVIIQLPPTSIKAFNTYTGSWISKAGIPPFAHITKITLKKETNKEGQDYSTVLFSHVRNLTQAELTHAWEVKAICEARAAAAQENMVAASAAPDAPADAGAGQAVPIATTGQPDDNGFLEIPDDALDELPFES